MGQAVQIESLQLVRAVVRASPQALVPGSRLTAAFMCRWSVMAYETKLPRQASSSTVVTEDFSDGSEVLPVSPLLTRPALHRFTEVQCQPKVELEPRGL